MGWVLAGFVIGFGYSIGGLPGAGIGLILSATIATVTVIARAPNDPDPHYSHLDRKDGRA